MKIKKVLLIYPSALYAPNWGSVYYVKPSLLNLLSFLKTNNVKVDILDLENEIGRPRTEAELGIFNKEAFALLSKKAFDVAAISCWSSVSYLSSVSVADFCRQINPKSIIAVGGYHPSAVPEDFIYENSPFNFIIKGEGEIALLNIALGKEKLDFKPRVIQGVPLNLKNDFKLYWGAYRYPNRFSDDPIYLSRGCPYACAFCMESSKAHTGWRHYSVDNAIRKIKALNKINKSKFIRIEDACFGFSNKWRKEFLRALIKNRMDNIFWVETRADILDREDVDLFSRLNFKIGFGLESGSREMLLTMRKTRDPDNYLSKFANLIEYINEKEILYQIYMIFNHPGETRRTTKETISFLESLFSASPKVSGVVSGQNYAYFPGSHIQLNLRDYEKKFGTVIGHKEWWKEPGDQFKTARANIPSYDFKNNPENLNDWVGELACLNDENSKKASSLAKILRFRLIEVSGQFKKNIWRETSGGWV